jgi:hypothetical protein
VVGVDLFAPVKLEPVLSDEERAELLALESEAHLAAALRKVVDQVAPWTPTFRRTFDRVPMSDRAYIVAKDGSFRRMGA